MIGSKLDGAQRRSRKERIFCKGRVKRSHHAWITIHSSKSVGKRRWRRTGLKLKNTRGEDLQSEKGKNGKGTRRKIVKIAKADSRVKN